MNLSQSSDQELVESFKNGNAAVFDELIRRHAARLYRTAYALTDNPQDAEEVVQDAFVRAYKGLSGFRGAAGFATWMHRIVANLSRNKYHWNRRRGKGLNISLYRQHPGTEEAEESELPLSDGAAGPCQALENAEFERLVLAEFAALPDKLKEAMALRHINELPYEKIAECLNCKVGTVKSRLARGREILRNLIAKEGF